MNINQITSEVKKKQIVSYVGSLLGGQFPIQFDANGVALGTPGTVTEIDFTGSGVIGSRTGSKITYNIPGGGGGGGFYQTIENDSIVLPQRNKFNFFNGLTAVDNSGSARTDIKLGGQLTDLQTVITMDGVIATGFSVENGVFASTDLYQSTVQTSGLYWAATKADLSSFLELTLDLTNGLQYGGDPTHNFLIGGDALVKYQNDIHTSYDDRTLVDKGYVLGAKTFTGSQTFRTGTTGAGTAPAYIPAGTLLSIVENTALEATSTHLYYTVGGVRYQLDQQSGGSGTVTSVGFTGGLISVATPTTTPAFTVAGTSGGVPYFSSNSTWESSTLLAANALMIGGGAGLAPSTTTTGTGILTWLGTPSWTNFNSAITGTAPFWSLASGGALTGNNNMTGAFTHTFSLNGVAITQNAMSSGWQHAFTITPGAHTALTAATEFIDYDFGGGTRNVTWLDGTTPTQRFAYFRGNTVNKTTTSATFTDIYTGFSEKSIAGAGVTFTNNWAWGFGGNIHMQGDIRFRGATNPNIGTYDNNALLLVTNSTTRTTISNSGSWIFQNSSSNGGVFMTFTQSIANGSIANGLLWTGGAHTSQTTATEITDINFNLSAVLKMTDGTVATQRTFRIQGRTYTPQTSALTLTEVSTLEVTGPTAGAGTTFTNNDAWAIRCTGNLKITGARINAASLPTSSAGLASGDMWKNGNIVNIV